MKRFDYLKTEISKISNPKLVAHALSEYFAKMRENVLNKTAAIFEALDAPSSVIADTQEFVSYTLESGDIILLSLDDLLNKIRQNNGLSTDTDIINDVQVVSGEVESINVDLYQLVQSLQQETDSLLIGVHSFDAIASGSSAINSANDFANLLSNYAVANNSNIAQASTSIYNVIKSNVDTASKINSILELYGLPEMVRQLEEEPNVVPTINGVNIADYTGAKPVSTIIDSVPIKWYDLLTPVGPIKVTHFMGKCFDKMFLASWKIIWTTFNGLVNLVAKPIKSAIQVNTNPQDCYTDGDTYGFFKMYTSFKYCDDNTGNDNIIQRLYNNMKSSDYENTVFYTDFGLVAYHCQFLDSVQGYPGPVLNVNRYLRPVSPSQFENQLRIVMHRNNISSIDNVAAQHIFDALGELIQDDNAWLQKDADEKEVFLGLIYAQYFDMLLSEIFSISNGSIYNNYIEIVDWLNQDAINLPFTESLLAWKKVLAYRIDEAHQGFDNIIPDGSGYYGSDGNGFGSSLLTSFFAPGSTVSNYDFLRLLSAFPSSSGPRIQLEGFEENNDTIMRYSGEGINKSCASIFSLLVFKAFCENDLQGFQLDYSNANSIVGEIDSSLYSPFMGYSRNNIDIDRNSDIKTDKQNFDAAANWWTKFFVISASVAVVAIGALAFKKMSAYKQKVRASVDNSYLEYRNSLTTGDITLINDKYNELRQNQRLGRLIGATTSIHNPSLNDVISSNVGISSMLDTTKDIKALITTTI